MQYTNTPKCEMCQETLIEGSYEEYPKGKFCLRCIWDIDHYQDNTPYPNNKETK